MYHDVNIEVGGEGGGRYGVASFIPPWSFFTKNPDHQQDTNHRRVRTMVVFYEEPGPYETPHEKSGGSLRTKVRK